MSFNQLPDVRQTLYDTLGNACAALLALMAAVLVSACIGLVVSLSPRPGFRRGWSSTDAVRQERQLPRTKWLQVLVKAMPTQEQPRRVGAVSRWHRPAAKTLKERTFTGGGDSGSSVGHRYRTLAWRPEQLQHAGDTSQRNLF